MKSPAAALCLAALAAGAGAAPLPRGTVYKTEEGGGLVVVDKDGRAREYRIGRATKISRDGKPSSAERALIGDVVVRGAYDPKTKILSLLELKSGVQAAPVALPPKTVTGEVAMADAIKGALSVRTGKGALRDFVVGEETRILSLLEGQPAREVPFETVSVGDAVEVFSSDGIKADEIRVRAR